MKDSTQHLIRYIMARLHVKSIEHNDFIAPYKRVERIQRLRNIIEESAEHITKDGQRTISIIEMELDEYLDRNEE